MKTILLPTDFSLSAKNAGRYAMHLAKQMRVNLKLCYAVMVPVEVPMVAHVSLPLEGINELEQQAKEELKHAAEKISKLDDLESTSDTYHPLVTYGTGIGPFTDVVANFANDNNVSLVVMGMSRAGGLSKFLLGSSSRALVETATFPILLIPNRAKFTGLEKIAFATDLSKGDIIVIHLLAGFARTFNAEILIVHVLDRSSDNQISSRKKVDAFLNEITNKVNYNKIYYQHVLEESVDDGLDWLVQYGEIQLLAMVHRKHNILHRLFRGSHTQRLRKQVEIPLLVFPQDAVNKVL